MYGKTILIARDLSQQNVLQIFPNPVTDYVSVSYPAAPVKTTVSIYSMDGKKRITSIIAAGSGQSAIDVSALQKGLYFIKLDNAGKTIVGSFVK